METLEFNVDASANNIRIDRYLADQCPEHSRSYIQKLLKEEQVLVNGHVIKANYKTQSGDYIEFHIPDPEVLDILPENIPLDILYEDDYVLVVNQKTWSYIPVPDILPAHLSMPLWHTVESIYPVLTECFAQVLYTELTKIPPVRF